MKSNANIIGSSITEVGAGLSSGLKSFFESTNKTAFNQLVEARKDAQAQVFGLEQELKEGDEISVNKKAEVKTKAPSAEHQAYFREIITAPQRTENEDRQQLSAQIEEIRIEIRKLKDASTEMEVVFHEVSTQKTPEKPGKYHLNFYEWVFITIRNAREKMEEVNTLGSMVSNRRKEKQYLAMSKKHGTSFSLNNERAIARQAG